METTIRNRIYPMVKDVLPYSKETQRNSFVDRDDPIFQRVENEFIRFARRRDN